MIILKTLLLCASSADPSELFDKKRCEDGKLIRQDDVKPWLAHGEHWSRCGGNRLSID